MKAIISFIWTSSLLLISCKERERVIVMDPYTACFWNKNIKYMIERFDFDTTYKETTKFDADGNIIERNRRGALARYAYDKNHFLVRWLSRTDVSESEVITYTFDERTKTLKSFSYPIYKHNNWNYAPADIDSAEVDITTIMLDGDERIVKYLGPNNTTMWKYFYDDDLLILRQAFLGGDLFSEWMYEYHEGRLNKVMFNEDSVAFETIYFNSNGLPSHSTRRVDDSSTLPYKTYTFTYF